MQAFHFELEICKLRLPIYKLSSFHKTDFKILWMESAIKEQLLLAMQLE